jgi:predicted CXXCH cytochrome family protein
MLACFTIRWREALPLAGLLWLLASAALAQDGNDGAAGTQRCRECHDHAPASHVERLLMGSHGISLEAGFRQGCEDCHGASAAHAAAPREVSPATSFGPRWKANSDAHDRACLNCHQGDTGSDWQHALHMVNNLTCVTCHDIHTEGDRVLLPEGQAAVCTGCHEAQRSGMHGHSDALAQDPPCGTCHNPHNHETAQPQMQANQSMGCRTCHDLAAMADDPLVSHKARDYHQTMQDPGRTCLSCHQGIAHDPNDPRAPLKPVPATGI